MSEELSQKEKSLLLGITDGKAVKYEDNYDHEFYEAMCRTYLLRVQEIDNQVRRAILHYIADSKSQDIRTNGTYIMMGFIHGYMVGKKLQRDIRRK